MTTTLYRSRDHQPVAYTTDGRNYYRYGTHERWAYRSGNSLYAAKDNRPIAYPSGKHWYDAQTRRPVFYEWSARSGYRAS